MGKEAETILIAVSLSLLVVGLAEFARPKGARWFDHGAAGENTLAFDPASAKK